MSAGGHRAAPQGDLQESATSPSSWRALRFFNAYRLTIAALLLSAHAFSEDFGRLGLPRADQFMLITTGYGLAAFVLLTLDELRLGGYALRLQLGLAIDIVALGLLGFASGAAHDNIHILLVVNVAYASLLLGGRESLAFAALGSVWLLLLAGFHARGDGRADVLFTHAGVIGMALFAVAVLARNLAYRLEASQQLAEQRGLDLANETQINRLILERTDEGVLIVDGDDFARHANRAALRLLRCDDPAGGERRKPLAQVHPALKEALHAWRQQPDDGLATVRIDHPERLQVRFTPLAASPQGPVALFIEDDASLMEQLQQAKLAALGRLTASIAHEIRNPLGAIGHAGQILEESAADEQDQQMLAIIRKQVARINRIVENVLSTSRRKLARPETIELGDWTEEFLQHYTRLHTNGEAPRIELQADPGLEVRADPGHLEQILTILLDNALQHGCGASGERFARIEIKRTSARRPPTLDVIDHGYGVPPEVRDRLFEPFFTTSTQGNGLGLFIARELAEANHLGLHHHAEAEGGSRFTLSFPREEIRE